MEHRDHYQAYLLRIWLVEEESKLEWRASLENAHTGERQGFTTLARLTAYLESHTEAIRCEAEIAKQER
ncbi:MAG: hypothetical protein U0175_25035 [Caldilineaceae bacterium]